MSFLAIVVCRNLPWPYCSSGHLIAQGWKLQFVNQTKIVFFSCLLAMLQKSLTKNINLSLLTFLLTVFFQPAYTKDLILEWLIQDKNWLLVIPVDLAPVPPISLWLYEISCEFLMEVFESNCFRSSLLCCKRSQIICTGNRLRHCLDHIGCSWVKPVVSLLFWFILT